MLIVLDDHPLLRLLNCYQLQIIVHSCRVRWCQHHLGLFQEQQKLITGVDMADSDMKGLAFCSIHRATCMLTCCPSHHSLD